MSDGTGLDESEELSAAATHRATSLDDLRPSVEGSLSLGPLSLVEASEPWVLFAPEGTPHVQRQLSLLKATGGQVHHLGSRDLMTEQGVYRAFAEALRFPQYFGRNWDALVDCLDDLCGAVTGGVGLAVVVRDADPLLDADHFPLLVSVLCQAADRANSAVDLDGCHSGRPAVAEHFVFEFHDFDCEKVARRIEHPDLSVAVENGVVTATLNPEEWH